MRQFYKHHKGNEYELLGIATVISKMPDFGPDAKDRSWTTVGAFDSEKVDHMTFVWLDEESGKRYVVDPHWPDGTMLALYKNTQMPKLWVRLVDDFTGLTKEGVRRFAPVVDPVEMKRQELATLLEKMTLPQMMEVQKDKAYVFVFTGVDIDSVELEAMRNTLKRHGIKANLVSLPEGASLKIFDVSLTQPK